ncbi:MAG: response regulator transcription factor [Rhodospirillales bacterium]|nr:response regulator transcription factor [Rhodospirillales bacterium]
MRVRDQQVFVLEDELEIGRLLCRSLEEHGYRSELFQRAADFQRRLRIRTPNLCIVDLGLPDGDGLQVVREIESSYRLPVIIVTGRGGVVDRVIGLELGADDYVVKPFDPREVVARVGAVLRRCTRSAESNNGRTSDLAKFGEWCFDFDRHTLTGADGTDVDLSAAEAQLLQVMVRQPNRILSRDLLLGTQGADDRSPFDRSIDVRISRLRQKVEADPKNPQVIKTVYGAGYMFTAKVDWVAKTD